SGGADSTALLVALCALRGELGLRLAAVHVDHGLRAASGEDAAFCQRLCDNLGVPLLVKRVAVPRRGSLEAAAREARYAAFDEAMRETGAKVLALAHHLDDQAETVLLHLLYGAGSAGLGGMAEYRPPLWRPLLGLRRETLRQALRGIGRPWREDETNADTAYTRNLLRARVIPAIEEAFPEAARAMGRAGEILRGEDDLLEDLARGHLSRCAAHGRWRFLMAQPALALHPALQRRVLRMYARECGIPLHFEQTEALCALLTATPETRQNLPGGWHALRTKERLHFLPPASEPPHWEESLLREIPCSGETGDGKLKQAFPGEILKDTVLRTKREGDWIRPFGMRGRMKLKDYFSGRGVDGPFRADWPLLCSGSEVLWAVGIGASETLRLDKEENARMLTFAGVLPDTIQEENKNE
ncbi:MAG: tRNA lysidine(34) synthetase TilS, partial [Clostridia bacterium]|nr:tRNA lysidine(34) synthetase TilS [Clostridia bacterium]